MGDAAKPATPKLTDLLRFVATLPHSEWYLERGTLLLNRSDVATFVEQASIIEADQTLGQALARIHACDADLFMMIFGTETVEEYVEMLEPEDVDERWHPARESFYPFPPLPNVTAGASTFVPTVVADLLVADASGQAEYLPDDVFAEVAHRLRKSGVDFAEVDGLFDRLLAFQHGGNLA